MTEKAMYQQLVNGGLSPLGASVLLGNYKAESGLQANNLQNTSNKKLNMTDEEYTQKVDDGTYLLFETDGAGYGLAQWTYWSRKKQLLEYARSRNLSIGDPRMQLDFSLEELKSYKTVLLALTTGTNMYEICSIVVKQYEKPADQSEDAIQKRLKYCVEIYQKCADIKETQAEKVIHIAQGEIGTCEPTGDDKYIQVYNQLTGSNFAMNVAWCAIFVTWCHYMAGVPKTVVPYYANCDTGMKWFQDRKQFFVSKGYGGSYTPHPGDVVFFSSKHNRNDSTHTGIVVKSDGKYLYTIEGNTSDAVHERTYDIADKYILGYGRPAYNEIVDNEDIQTPTAGYTLYTVVKNDTLWGIAKKYMHDGERYREIMSLNSLTSTTIHPGLVLMIPGSNKQASDAEAIADTYTVQRGDSLWRIAANKLGDGNRYHEIMHLNGLTSTTIYAGQTLYIPWDYKKEGF